jgi:hypothetical protein
MTKHHTGHCCADGSHIEDFNLTKTGHMRHKAVHSRANIHMLDRLGRMNGTRHQQVLPKVFALGRTAFFIAVMQAGHKLHVTRVALAEGRPVT